ncbi:hypothetical protein ABHP49_005600, partial [Bacillus cereus]
VKKKEKQDFPGYKSKGEIPTVKEWDGVTWYLKGATEVSKNSWTGHYEGWRTSNN